MDGAALAAKRSHEAEIIQAWHVAVFGVAAYNGKLKSLDRYIAKPKRQQSNAEMLAIMREFKAAGASMTFKKMN